ncbi:unnamed protein product [Ambrosiozyma monospora]|uniref:Unnamed protein product n=1 Tax=Ambrosiozyma monospora TaxID=43982 RepID=A0ACB5T5L5_AMBMO|nr:unnamed protein product [Ambrosiozyma monospora]
MQPNTISRFESLKEVNVSVSEPITNFMFLQLLYKRVSVLSIDLVGLADTVFNTDLQDFLRLNDQVLFSANWLTTSILPIWCSFNNERSSDLHLLGDAATSSDVQSTIAESTEDQGGLETGGDVSIPIAVSFSISELHILESLTFSPPFLSQFEHLIFENPTMRNFTISHIEHIRNTSFENLPSLKELWLDSPKSLTIDQFSFNSLPCSSLRVLQLKYLEISPTTQLRSFVVPKYIRSFRCVASQFRYFDFESCFHLIRLELEIEASNCVSCDDGQWKYIPQSIESIHISSNDFIFDSDEDIQQQQQQPNQQQTTYPISYLVAGIDLSCLKHPVDLHLDKIISLVCVNTELIDHFVGIIGPSDFYTGASSGSGGIPRIFQLKTVQSHDSHQEQLQYMQGQYEEGEEKEGVSGCGNEDQVPDLKVNVLTHRLENSFWMVVPHSLASCVISGKRHVVKDTDVNDSNIGRFHITESYSMYAD